MYTQLIRFSVQQKLTQHSVKQLYINIFFLSVCFIFFQYLFAWSLKDPQLHKGVLSFTSLSIQKYCTINILHITAEAASELCPWCWERTWFVSQLLAKLRSLAHVQKWAGQPHAPHNMPRIQAASYGELARRLTYQPALTNPLGGFHIISPKFSISLSLSLSLSLSYTHTHSQTWSDDPFAVRIGISPKPLSYRGAEPISCPVCLLPSWYSFHPTTLHSRKRLISGVPSHS